MREVALAVKSMASAKEVLPLPLWATRAKFLMLLTSIDANSFLL
jgi:hypothetical protein